MSAPSPKTVFLSGTRRDLREHFIAAQEAINRLPGYRALVMEEGTAEGIGPDRWSRREASKPDAFVGLMGHFYGTIPDGATKSISEQEYEAALAAGIEPLMFVTDQGDRTVADSQPAAGKPGIAAFRERVQRECTYKPVGSPADFAKRAVEALQAWEKRTWGGATLDVERYFQPWLAEEALLGHTIPLIGQEGALHTLEEFPRSDKRALVVEGPWGSGKSRLLMESARRTSTTSIRFVKPGVEFSRETLNISAVDPCVLVIEDAHRLGESELRALLSLVGRFGPEVRLIVSTRLSHVQGVLEMLREQGFDAPVRLEVPALSDAEQRALVALIVGEDGEAAYRIAARTAGNPMAAIIAARLVQRGAATLKDIEQSSEFNYAVINAFRKATLEQASLAQGDCDELLKLLSVAGPVRPDDDDGMAALAVFLQWTPERLRDALRRLEEAGLLLRRGGLVRIPVDAIAEAEPLHACVNQQGESLGYAEKALKELLPTYSKNVLRNLATATWDARQSGRDIDLLSSVWPRLNELFDGSPMSVRIRLLRDMESIAYLVPKETLAFVKNAMRAPVAPSEPLEEVYGRLSDSRVNDSFSMFLRGALQDPLLVPDACDLLWELARDDKRSTNAHPQSAERILGEAAEYRINTRMECLEAFLDWAERRLDERVPGDRMATYLRPLLKREALHEWSDDRSMYMRSYRIDPMKVAALRVRALNLLERVAKSINLRDAQAAIKVIGQALATQLPAFGRQVTDAEAASWHAEEMDALQRLGRIRAHHASRVVDLCVLSELLWIAEHSPNEPLRAAAGAMVADIRSSLQGSLELALSPAWQIERPSAVGTPEHDNVARETGKRLAASGRPAGDVLAEVSDAVLRMATAAREPRPDTLLFAVGKEDPVLGEAIVDLMLATPDHPLEFALDSLIYGLLDGDADTGRRVLETCLARASVRGRRVLAQAYRYRDWIPKIGAELSAVQLRRLMADVDESVRHSALLGMSHADGLSPSTRVQLLLEYDLGSAPATGEDWAMAIAGPQLHISCSNEEAKTIAKMLAEPLKLEHWSCVLIEHFSTQVPAAIVDMLLERMRRAGTREGFEPVPDVHNRNPLSRLPVEDRRRALYELGEALGSSEFIVTHNAGKLASLLAVQGSDLHEVQLAWARSGLRAKVVQAANSLRGRTATVFFDEEGLVVEILGAADRLGTETLGDVTSILLGISWGALRTSSPGEPAPLDVKLRDDARAAAARYGAGTPGRRFYEALAEQSDESIRRMQRRFEEESIE